MRLLTIPLFVAALSASACMSDDFSREEGLTSGAGEAIAANTVMQMVDPWQYGVQDTDLDTPADLGQYRRAQAAASGATTQSDSSVAGAKP